MDQPGQPQYLLSLAPCCLHFYDKKPHQHVSHRGRYCNQASQACPVRNADFCDCCSPLRCLSFNWQPQNRDVRTHSLESLFCYPESSSQLLTCSIWQVEKKKEKKKFPFPSLCGFSHKLVKLPLLLHHTCTFSFECLILTFAHGIQSPMHTLLTLLL